MIDLQFFLFYLIDPRCIFVFYSNTHSLQWMVSGHPGPPGVGVRCRAEQVFSLATASVPAPSARAVVCHVWVLTERTKSASLLHVTVSLFLGFSCISLQLKIDSEKVAVSL